MSSLPTANPNSQPLFTTWGNQKDKDKAVKDCSTALNGLYHKTMSYHSGFRDVLPNQSVRTQFTREDYEFFRPAEATPVSTQDSMKAAQWAYKRVSIVRNVIDLMADFGCQGINLTHPNKRIQKFYREWFRKVNGKDRSERFLNLLYRIGNLAVKRTTAKLKIGDVNKLRKGIAKPDLDKLPREVKVQKREVPWIYTFINPLALKAVGEDISHFVGKNIYTLSVSSTLRRQILTPRTKEQKELAESLPTDIKQQIIDGKKEITLDMDKVKIFHYKKDDWEVWAEPMVGPMIKDLILLEKMKLADQAALDGVISKVRIWKLGDLEHKILPTEQGINLLSDILHSNVGGGTVDLIWNAAITLEETSTDMHEFLGEKKYEPVMNSIFQGLGVPPTLTGSSNSSGFTNNFISLKTLVERLRYGRDVLVNFWEEEVRLVQKAMGFKVPAEIEFDRMSLTDENAEKALLLQLWDRSIISDEAILERFGESPDLEKVRINRENKERDKGQRVHKAGPWHNPQIKEAFQKIALQRGLISPEQLGIVSSPIDVDDEQKGEPQQGRPFNSKDTEPRQRREFQPRTSIGLEFTEIWAMDAQQKIADIVNPIFLEQYSKKNMRSLSSEEFSQIEKFKFGVLCELKPFSKITEQTIANITNQKLSKLPEAILIYNDFIKAFIEHMDRQPNIDDCRHIQSKVYALLVEKVNNEQNNI